MLVAHLRDTLDNNVDSDGKIYGNPHQAIAAPLIGATTLVHECPRQTP
jgi:hypothetical protein